MKYPKVRFHTLPFNHYKHDQHPSSFSIIKILLSCPVMLISATASLSHPPSIIGNQESALKKSPGAYGVETIHESIAYCYIIIDGEGKRVASSHYCGNDCVDNFLLDLSDCWAAIRSQRKTFPIDMSTEDERTFQQQTVCQMCKTSFKHDHDKHRHHDHAEPKNNFIGAYCARCNLACRELKTRLPVFAHNSSYDLGLILKELKTKVDITIMTKQGLKNQRMTVGNLVFLDSLAFLGSSLDSLASEYFRDGRKAGLTEDMLSEIRDDKLRGEVIQGKLPFCYDYIDSLAKLNETHLPPKTAFYNKLRERDISEDYDKYGLDLPHYVSLPSYAFDSFLKMSEIELDHVYDEELYNLIRHNARATDELPLCLSHEEVAFKNLSPYCKSVLEHEGGRMTVKCKKLMATHHSKKEYLISLPLLQLYMDLGLELEVVHSIYEFSQSAYMKDFIKTNIEVVINMPNYIGFAILESAKFDLYYFFYKVLKNNYGDKVKLLYTDTDSFIFALEVDDLNSELAQEPLKSYMDFSNFDVDHPLFSNKRKGELGLLKSETGSNLITEVKALKPKMYSMLVQKQGHINRAKGIPSHMHASINHEQYSQILEDHRVNYLTVRTIRNVRGQMSTTKVKKKCLSAFDSKRYHTSPYNSYAYGHPDIEVGDEEVASEVRFNNPLPKLLNPPSEPIPRVSENLWKKREEKVTVYFPPTDNGMSENGEE
ncbi:uncharacterized protein [Palaemon carinicauda]|uniref:uncharacterized protein n=1 Tax=Palaemon carinicauda TaxID=392227 RepID=UPI0035B64679